MQIKPDEITSILKSRIEGLDVDGADLSEVGTVLSVGDGIARLHGLENCEAFEMLDLPNDVTGLALNLESDNVGAVLFGDWEEISEGDTAKRTGHLLEIPVGEELLGRIVDPLGRPLDGKGDITTTQTRPAEFKAPGVVHRQPVSGRLAWAGCAFRRTWLLLRRPPGREAYPGDVFYLPSRLLERAVKLNDGLGGGSLTALPIIETQAGDVSAYIPANVISITDGQIYLESDLFFSGVRPAVNVGISVSRVGASAQTKAMKKVAGRLRLDLSQYRELEAFAQFGSELDQATQNTLARGERMVATLNQPQYDPWPMEEQVAALYAGVHGFLDEIPVAQVPRFQEELREHLRTEGSVLKDIRESGDLSDETAGKLEAELKKFKKSFNVEQEDSLV